MTENTAEDLAAETLSGDLRDVMLTHIRSMETPWSKMSEKAQSDKIYAITNATETIVRRAVSIIAAQGNEPMFGRIAKFTVKDEIKAELVASSSVANIEKVAENIGQPAIIIFANPDQFVGQKSEAKPDKDQPDLPIEDEAEEGTAAKPAELQPMEPAPEEAGLTPFEQGEGAAKHGLDLSHNPFEEGSEAWAAWRDGFNFAVGSDEKTDADAEDDADQSDAPEAA